MRTILHSDCNSFYASVECRDNPEIRDKPVAVGGNEESRHGIILAKNELAKKFNIITGETIYSAKQKCPELVVVPPHFEKYIKISESIKKIYLDYTDMVEPFGLDECWLDVTGSGILGDGMTIARDISKRIKREIGITVSIGVSFNKIFAKLGSDYKKPDAITYIGAENFREIVWPLPAKDLLYVGKATEKKLEKFGIHTIGELARLDADGLKSHFGRWGEILHAFANGLDASPVAVFGSKNHVKSIGNSSTTPRDLKNNEDVKIMMSVLSDSVARRLREHGFFTSCVSISVRDNELMSFTRQKTLDRPTNITSEINDAAMELFLQNYRWNRPIRSVGVSVSSLTPSSFGEQITFFDAESRGRLQSLDKTLDKLKERFGSYCVRPALLLLDKKLSGFSPKEDHVIHPVGYF